MSDCTCGRIAIGLEVTDLPRNWNPECPEHGERTDWFKGPGGDHMRASQVRSAIAQKRARQARKTGIPTKTYKYRTTNRRGESLQWHDNHALQWMSDAMASYDADIKSIVVTYEDGSTVEQQRQDGSEPWHESH